MQIIFEQLSMINFIKTKLPIKLKIIQEYVSKDPIYQNPNYGANFTLVINSTQDLIYARNLLNIYVNLVQPFLENNKKTLSKLSDDFMRFYFFRSPLVLPEYGKAFTNLDTATDSGPHGPKDVFILEDYYISHFRSIAILERNEALIDTIVFDFNYFFCYVQPIIQRISKT